MEKTSESKQSGSLKELSRLSDVCLGEGLSSLAAHYAAMILLGRIRLVGPSAESDAPTTENFQTR